MNSTHKVEVVRLCGIEKHPNADTLSVVKVYDYPCIVRTDDFKDGDLAAYIPPDSVVDVAKPEFAFLAKGTKVKHRIRASKIRGILSMGLLVPSPEGYAEGEDVAEYFAIEHYEPEMRSACTEGEAEAAPAFLAALSRYDVDTIRRYSLVFTDGELVMITEKIHGANARFCCMNDRMWCGSRGEWKRQNPNNLWWRALRETPQIETFCRNHVGSVLYGEVYGDVQELRYGCKKEVRFAAFDILDPVGTFTPAEVARDTLNLWDVPAVPLLGIIPYSLESVLARAEGPSTVPGADHIREGCVVKPLQERWHQAIGRVQLKVVGSGYLTKA